MLARIPEAAMLVVGLALALLTIWMNGVPHEFGDVRTYTFYLLALTPSFLWLYGFHVCNRKPWSRVLSRTVWIVFLILIAISLNMWRTNGWAGIIWYCVAGAWLAVSVVLALIRLISFSARATRHEQ